MMSVSISALEKKVVCSSEIHRYLLIGYTHGLIDTLLVTTPTALVGMVYYHHHLTQILTSMSCVIKSLQCAFDGEDQLRFLSGFQLLPQSNHD
jgi:hypothetical protein